MGRGPPQPVMGYPPPPMGYPPQIPPPPMGQPPMYFIPAAYHQQRPSRLDYNLNFNYEEANFLTDTTIVENTVYCVICGSEYRGSERDEHLKKHIRKGNFGNNVEKYDYVAKTSGKNRNYIIRPIIEPEEHNIQYEPIVYNLVQEIFYEDPANVSARDEAIGGDV
jgi:hypothetical protein